MARKTTITYQPVEHGRSYSPLYSLSELAIGGYDRSGLETGPGGKRGVVVYTPIEDGPGGTPMTGPAPFVLSAQVAVRGGKPKEVVALEVATCRSGPMEGSRCQDQVRVEGMDFTFRQLNRALNEAARGYGDGRFETKAEEMQARGDVIERFVTLFEGRRFVGEGSREGEEFIGGPGDDKFVGRGGDDDALASGGRDVLNGGGGKNALFFTTIEPGRKDKGVDVDVETGDAKLPGGDVTRFRDFGEVSGTFGDDVIKGADDPEDGDALFGEAGDDKLLGRRGDDFLEGGLGDDRLLGGAGDDRLRAGPGNDVVKGGAGADLIEGENGRDLLRGDAGADEMHGGAGRDRMFGGAGDDELRGGGGNDRLQGDGGFNVLFGDAGADEFVLSRGGFASVEDFDLGEDAFVLAGGLTFDDLTIEQPGGIVEIWVGEDFIAQVAGATQAQIDDAALFA